MRDGIRWWQLSDLHWPERPSQEQKQYVALLLAHLREVAETSGVPDFVLFTGDIARSGGRAEYAGVSELLLTPLRDILGDGTPMLFVPGNHDMDRAEARMKAPHLITELTDAAAVDTFLAQDRRRANFADPFRNYQECVAKWAPAGTDDAYQWTYDVEVGGKRLRILGINSAWAGYYHSGEAKAEGDRGRLLLSIAQTPAPDDTADFALFAQHHPFDWLEQDISAPAMRSLGLRYQIGLFGHLHSPRELGLLTTPHSKLLRVPSMLFFGRPHGDNSAEFVRGYATGEILFAENACRVRYFKYENVHSGQFREHLDVYEEGKGAPLEALQPLRRSTAAAPPQGPGPGGASFAALQPEIDRLRALVPELLNENRDLEHTLGVFQHVVELVNARSPLTAYGSAEQVALAYVLAEAAIARHSAKSVVPGAEAAGAAATAGVLDRLARAARDVSTEDVAELRTLLKHLSLSEPSRIKRAGDFHRHPTAASFAFLWGLAHLAQLLDNPGLMDADAARTGEFRRHVLGVHERDAADSCLVFDLATRGRQGFHLAAEALHTVHLYFTELEDAWRKWQLIRPPVRFELRTPNWTERSLQSHELRVDSRPITRLLMGSALYGDRPHVWLRELVQNAVDATAMRVKGGERGYVPRVEVELQDAHHVVIRDNGVGMTYQQVVTQLSVLGRSGWREAEQEEAVEDGPALFGRFGIGFASVFSAAASVEVRTRVPDSRPVDGILVQFSSPDRPFYTDHTTCEPGTEIRIQLSDTLSTADFRDTMVDFFAYLPPCLHVVPDLRLPTSLRDFSPLARFQEDLNGWRTRDRYGSAQFGPYAADFKLQVLHDPKPSRRKGNYKDKTPTYSNMGHTSVTFCVDGIRITEQRGLRPKEEGAYSFSANRDGNLSGCHLTVDFRRDSAPVTASRNELDSHDELYDEVERLVYREVAELLPELVKAAQVATLNDSARRRAGYLALTDVLQDRAQWGKFHASQELTDAATRTYLEHCLTRVRSADGETAYVSLADIDPRTCSVATLDTLTRHAVFPAFSRANGLSSWIVAADKRELGLIQDAWPHEKSLRVVDQAHELTEDFQRVLPEVREGYVWQLLRADHALAESEVFGDSLYVPLPKRYGTVGRADGVTRRRSQTAPTERPRRLLNRRHPVITAIETHLAGVAQRTPGADVPRVTRELTDWLDLFCDQVLDEERVTVSRERWKQLRQRLTELTGTSLDQFSVEALSPSWRERREPRLSTEFA
ncbi:metallophosphoesterase [Streptomyces melanogenes]|uniref:metallophosphoesterase n=1 Tax=Streptomyces melanogenes TaxID=67326 RepID=UPI00378CB46A